MDVRDEFTKQGGLQLQRNLVFQCDAFLAGLFFL